MFCLLLSKKEIDERPPRSRQIFKWRSKSSEINWANLNQTTVRSSNHIKVPY